MRNTIILSALLAAACGGPPKGSLGKPGTAPPPPPSVGQQNDVAEPGKPDTAKVEVSADAKKDYHAAVESFRNQDKSGGWNESACKGAADKFTAVVREHSDLIAAQFMVGLSYQRCNMDAEAEAAYQSASRMKGDPARAAMA